MASFSIEITTKAVPETVWDAIKDIGALHTRLVPGFVVHTALEQGARVVTFGNGMQVREPIIDLDETKRRLVWSAEAAGITHYNARQCKSSRRMKAAGSSALQIFCQTR